MQRRQILVPYFHHKLFFSRESGVALILPYYRFFFAVDFVPTHYYDYLKSIYILYYKLSFEAIF